MNAQSHDRYVLCGAAQMLDDQQIDFILCEVGFSKGEREIAFIGDIHDHLIERGFIFYGLYDPRDWTKLPSLTFTDALFVHRSQLSTLSPL